MISKEEYLQATRIVYMYTLQEIKRENRKKSSIRIEIELNNMIVEKVEELIKVFDIKTNREIENKFRRQAIMWWLRKNTSFSLKKIGELMGGYGHATVINAIKIHNQLSDANDKLYVRLRTEVFDFLEPYKKSIK